MPTTIITKYGSGAPTTSDVVQGELAVDTTNGRLYTLDGSSVIEIGLNPSGNVDVTGTVTADGLTVTAATPSIQMTDSDNNADAYIQATDGNIRFYADDNNEAASSIITFNIDGGEKVRVTDGGNVGIGTTSPTEKLFLKSSSGDVRMLLDAPTGSDAEIKFSNNGTIEYTIGHDDATDNFVIGTANVDTPKVSVTKAGNVGIGESSPQTPLHISSDSASGDNVALQIDNNDQTVGNEITMLFRSRVGATNTDFLITGVANGANDMDLAFRSDGGTERMRIDSSGNVGIGTASPSELLHVSEGSSGAGRSSDADTLFLENNGNAGITIGSSTTGTGSVRFADSGGTGRGVLFYDHSSDFMSFHSAGGERMRIDSSGNLLVGTTNTANLATATPNIVTDESYGINDGSNKATFSIDRINFDSSNYYVLNGSAIGVRLINGATAWTTQSDETLKENITTLTDVLPKVQNLRCVSYNLKAQTENDVKLGFIAQDWQADFPQVVNADASDGKLGMNYTETIPVLLKAIQEQQDLIESLTARITALEGAN